MSKTFIGIDVSKQSLSITIVSDHIQELYISVENNLTGFKKLTKIIKQNNLINPVICMEATGIYSLNIANYMHNLGYFVSITNPVCIHSFAKSKLSRHKTDKVDSKIIAQYASCNNLARYMPADPIKKELKDLHNCRSNLQNEERKFLNFLESSEHLSKDVAKIYKQIIKDINDAIREIDEKIDSLIECNDDIKVDIENIITIPGIGKKTAIAFLSTIEKIDSFKNAREVAAFIGLTPKQYSSGSSINKKSHISKMGSHRLRKELYFPAMSAMRCNELMVKLAQRLRQKGKSGKVIIVAIMRKLVHIIFGIIKNKSTFNPNLAID